jgi:putative ABC transport system permease protein
MGGLGTRFWLIWSWRDLRRRWPLVLAIGLLLAGGTGLAAGLGSMRGWRVDSNDRSFAALSVHDLRLDVEEGGYAPAGALRDAALAIPAADSVDRVAEQLVAPTQIDASALTPEPVLTPGQLIGVEQGEDRTVDGVDVTGPGVDAIAIEEGRGFGQQAGDGEVAVLDPVYAEENGITPSGKIELAGGAALELVGLGRSPETFVVTGPGGAFGATEDFGTVFVPLATAQRLTGREGQVNGLTLTLEPGADRDAIGAQLERTVRRQLPGLGVRLSVLEDLDSHRILYDDAENDQQLFNVFAFLILAGAAFGAFNLVSRTIEAQRREIGIGMALGVPPQRLAVRPMMLGLQIAVIGVALGVGVGLLVNEWLRGLLADQLPLPIVEADFQPGTFLRAAAIGLVIPLVAAAWPVRRGLRVTPIEAIRVGFRAARGGGLAPLVGRLPLPGNSLAQMPPRNVLRAPRRTLLTVLATGAVVSVAVSMSGMIDSFAATVDRNQAEELRGGRDRLSVSLDRFYRDGSGPVRAVESSPAVARSDLRISVPAELRAGDQQIDVVIETLPGGEAVWSPRAGQGRLPRGPHEILIAETAAEDLGVAVGDAIEVSHPRRVGPDRFETAVSTVRVVGLHPDPFRFPAFVEPQAAAQFGLEGRVNRIEVMPADGFDPAAAKQALFGVEGTASIEAASALGESLDKGLDEFAAVIRVVTTIAIALVLLIAFNSTAINADERAREHATMFAYGLPTRTVLRLAVLESLIMGVLATLLGVAIGIAILNWVVDVSFKEVLPELGVVVSLSPASVLLAALAGAGAMAAAPLLTVRRLRRMDVPSTLRVVE